jgi:hypothetical protein
VRPDLSVDPRAACIFDSLLARFALYQGGTEEEVDGRTERVPFESQVDMAFNWTVTGGFTSLRASIASQTLTVSPVSLQFVPQLGQLAVVDGAAAGLSFISLETLGVSRLFF